MLIKVKVLPGQKKEKVIKKGKDSFEVKVKEKPIKGQANKAMISALADYFKISPSKLRIIKGKRQRNKIVDVL